MRKLNVTPLPFVEQEGQQIKCETANDAEERMAA